MQPTIGAHRFLRPKIGLAPLAADRRVVRPREPNDLCLINKTLTSCEYFGCLWNLPECPVRCPFSEWGPPPVRFPNSSIEHLAKQLQIVVRMAPPRGTQEATRSGIGVAAARICRCGGARSAKSMRRLGSKFAVGLRNSR